MGFRSQEMTPEAICFFDFGVIDFADRPEVDYQSGQVAGFIGRTGICRMRRVPGKEYSLAHGTQRRCLCRGFRNR